MLITRYAPSPTGYQHIWWIRTALYCWLLAKQDNGKFLLRIEDTDQARSTKLFEEWIIDSLRWFGLERDAGPDKDDGKWPYYQMPRLEIYNQYVQQLIDEWKAYYAWETPEEIDVLRKAAYANKQPFNFREIVYTPAQIDQFKAEWRKPVVRFKVPMQVVEFEDQVKGQVSFNMKEFGDFVILKSDGIPTYYLANVVDDHLQDVTHVIRGEEHLSNTPKQIVLYEALWRDVPHFAHLPLMLNPHTWKKMSKRDADIGLVLVPQFRNAGFLPEAVINFIALLWWNPWTEQEMFSIDQLIETFSMERVQSSNAVYDFKRALRFNSEYIKHMPDAEFVERVKGYLYLYGGEDWKEIIEATDEVYWMKLAPYIKVRLQTLEQFKDYCKYFFERKAAPAEIVYREKMKATPEIVAWFLPDVIDLLNHLDEWHWTEETIKDQLISFIKAKGLKNGQVLRPLRAILTGVEASPGAFEMLYVLGKEESLIRLKEFVNG